jgi:hypothetical protein
MTRPIIPAFLFFIATSLAVAQPISPEYLPPTVGVMLSFEHHPSRHYLQQIQRDVEQIFHPSRLDLRWQVMKKGVQPDSFSRVVVVQVRGRCGFGRVGELLPGREPHVRLGWTAVNDGEVIPHVTIDCDQIAAAIGAARSQGFPRATLPVLYHRLITRVIAHELMHALLASADHNSSDCLKSPLRLADLWTPARLSIHNLQALRDVGRTNQWPVASDQRPF